MKAEREKLTLVGPWWNDSSKLKSVYKDNTYLFNNRLPASVLELEPPRKATSHTGIRESLESNTFLSRNMK